MARNLALDYRERTSDISLSQASTSTTVPESSTSSMGDPRTFFDQVLYLECGENVDSSTKQVQLLTLLGWEEALQPQELTNPERAKYVKTILKQLLKESKVLIILDDVWHEELLDDVASLCGNRIRILATTQRSRLCDDSLLEELVSISMDRITTEDARRILQVHAGFTLDDEIAEPIQECMTDLISKVSTNPHALASVASAIDRRRPTHLSEWENAIHEHDKLLSDASSKILKIHGIPYSSTIGMKFARLNAEERKMMMLMAILDGPSVLETVLQLFNTEIMVRQGLESHRSSIGFSNCRKQLEDLQCIKVSDVDGQLSWSIHFLDRKFVQDVMADDMHSMFQNFRSLPMTIQGLEIEPQEHFVKLLGALYFRSELAKEIILTFSFPKKEKRFNASRRNAVQSTIFLMLKNVYKDWTFKERSSADQVFLSYVCHGIIHEEALGILLRSTISEQSRLSVLLDIVKVSDIWLSEEVIMNLLCVFGELRVIEQNKNAFRLNLQHCQILHSLAKAGGLFTDSHLVRLSICSMTKVILGLVEILGAKDAQIDFREQCISTIPWLGHEESPDSDQDRVALLVETPTLLRELVRVLEDDTCSSLQEASAEALSSFGLFAKIQCGARSGVAQKVFETAGKQLFRSLRHSCTKTLQEHAACTLGYLARVDREVSLKLFNSPSSMDCFFDVIGSRNGDSDTDFDGVKWRAAYVLHVITLRVWPSPEADLGIAQRMSDFLAGLFADRRHLPEELERYAADTLMVIDSARAKGLQLISAKAIRMRGRSLVKLGLYEDGLSDLKKAAQMLGGQDWIVFSCLAVAKARLEDLEGALKDADRAVEIAFDPDSIEISIDDRNFVLAERGVLKRMMGDLPGALGDLDESMKLVSDDYEVLKQRAYVKYCLGDVNGAYQDAEKALPLRPNLYDNPAHEHEYFCTSTVEFLTFQL